MIYPKKRCVKALIIYHNDLRLASWIRLKIEIILFLYIYMTHAFDVATEKYESNERFNYHRSLFSVSVLKSWSCYQCGKRYMWRDSLMKHLRVECGKDPSYECPICGRKFKHKHRWQSHARLIHYINIWVTNSRETIDICERAMFLNFQWERNTMFSVSGLFLINF